MKLPAAWNSAGRWNVAVWSLLTVSLFVYAIRFGRNVPMWEEWLDLEALFADSTPWHWIFGRLNEHRYVLGRATYYALFHATGHDFRAGIFVSVALLSASSVLLQDTARRVRGRAHLLDVAIPLTLLNPGGYENLLLGYQMHFTIDILLISCLLRFAVLEGTPHATAWRVSLTTAALALGGWVGLTFAPGATVWVLYLATRRRRLGDLAATLPAVAACGFLLWSYRDLQLHPITDRVSNGAATTLRVAAESLSMAFGPLGPMGWPVSGVSAVGLTLALAGVLLRDLAARPDRRPAALGGLTALTALALMAYGTGQSRSAGFAARNVPLMAFLPILGLLLAARFARPVTPTAKRNVVTFLVLGLALAIHVTGFFEANRLGHYYRSKNEMFARDRDAGLPLEYLSSAHQLFPCQEIPQGLRILRDHQHPSARTVIDAPPSEAVALPIPVATTGAVPGDPLAHLVVGRAQVWHFEGVPGAGRRVQGVRVHFRSFRASERVPIQILWRKPDGTTGVSTCQPWLTPYTWTLNFWIDDTLTEFHLRTLNEADELKLLGVEVLFALPER